MVKSFEEYIEEGYNYITSELGEIEFEDRWFYYESDDEIIYGCDEEPVNQDYLFYFNPKSCVVVMDGKKNEYDINNPICLISYNFDNNEVKLYSEGIFDYLKSLGYDSDENIDNINNRKKIQSIFDKKDDDYKFILLSGNKLISTTFDIIEEN